MAQNRSRRCAPCPVSQRRSVLQYTWKRVNPSTTRFIRPSNILLCALLIYYTIADYRCWLSVRIPKPCRLRYREPLIQADSPLPRRFTLPNRRMAYFPHGITSCLVMRLSTGQPKPSQNYLPPRGNAYTRDYSVRPHDTDNASTASCSQHPRTSLCAHAPIFLIYSFLLTAFSFPFQSRSRSTFLVPQQCLRLVLVPLQSYSHSTFLALQQHLDRPVLPARSHSGTIICSLVPRQRLYNLRTILDYVCTKVQRLLVVFRRSPEC